MYKTLSSVLDHLMHMASSLVFGMKDGYSFHTHTKTTTKIEETAADVKLTVTLNSVTVFCTKYPIMLIVTHKTCFLIWILKSERAYSKTKYLFLILSFYIC